MLMKKFGDTQTVILALIAVGFFMYMASSYSNKKSELLSGFENNSYGGYDHYESPQTVGASEPYTSEPSSLMPNNSTQQAPNLLNPDQIIGMKGQVKRNQTYDLRGGIPVAKTKIPFNNSVFMEEDVRTHGMHGSFALNE